MSKIKIEIGFGKNRVEKFETKTFESRDKAMEWCRQNAAKIYMINNVVTFNQVLSHMDLYGIFNGLNVEIEPDPYIYFDT